MSYRLRDNETVPDGIKRIALEQLDTALQATRAPSRKQDKAIHEVRTSLKKVRALLRLLQDEIGTEVFQPENICYRDAGRRLSAVRDAAVILETFDQLTDQYAEQLAAEAFTPLRKALMRSNTTRRAEKQKALATVAKTLSMARRRIEQWPIDRDGFSALAPGLERTYRRGRRGLAQTAEQPSAECFHEWRKQVKCLWYQIRLLKPLWPRILEPLADELEALGDHLSDDHDLAILRERLLGLSEELDDRMALETLVALIDQRRGELQIEAQNLGIRIYAEKPGAFIGRMRTYWQAWRAEVQVDPIAVS